MPNPVTIPVASLIQGVSQQPDAVRFPSQAELQENAYPSIGDGLMKRHPFDQVAQLTTSNVGEPLIHLINRDANERYVVVVGYQSVRVFGLDGVEVPVKGPTTPFTPDFSYLDTTVANSITGPVDFTAGLGWTLNAQAATPATGATVGPLGLGLNKIIGSAAGAASPGKYSQAQGGFVAGPQTFSCYFQKGTTGTPATQFNLVIRDTTNVVDYTATFNITGTVISAAGTTNGAASGVEDAHLGWYRCWVTVSPATALGNARTVAIEMTQFGAPLRSLSAWGARIDAGSTPGDYYDRPSKYFKAVTIADYTFILNTKVVTAMTGATSGADSSDKAGYVSVLSGNYKSNYFLTLKKAAGADKVATVKTWDGSTLASGELKSPEDPAKGTIKTDNIALDIADQINSANPAANGNNYSGNAFFGDGWTAAQFSSVVKITRASTNIDKMVTGDSRGNTSFKTLFHHVDDIEDLPPICDDGFRVKVTGGTLNGLDDFYVKFIADVPGAFINGKWVESNGFNLATTLDAAKMPWQLIRKQDDGVGTVTGTPNAKYFQWSQVAWNTRDVGDDTTAPVPSFVGKPLNDVFFYRNRLGVLAGQNVVMSEAGRYFNFFRTTVRDLVDSDPIDVSVPHTSVVSLNHAVPFAKSLVLFSDLNLFVFNGEPTVTPKTVQISSDLAYETLRYARPIATAKGVFFGVKRGNFSGVPLLMSDPYLTDRYSFDDQSLSVPKYIPGEIAQFSASALENLLVVSSSSDRSSLYLFKQHFASDGSRLQSAWFKYTFTASAKVAGHGWIDNTLYLVVFRTDGLHLEKSVVSSGRVDEEATYLTPMDRRFKLGPDVSLPGTYNSGPNTTTWPLPYFAAAGEVFQVVTRATASNPNGGIPLATTLDTSGNPHTVTVPGNYASTPVWIGQNFTMRYQFTKPTLKVSADRASTGKTAVASGRVQVLVGRVVYNDSAYFKATVTPFLRPSSFKEFAAPGIASGIAPDSLPSDSFRFPVLCRAQDAVVEISSDKPLPVNLVSAEWEATYTVHASNAPS